MAASELAWRIGGRGAVLGRGFDSCLGWLASRPVGLGSVGCLSCARSRAHTDFYIRTVYYAGCLVYLCLGQGGGHERHRFLSTTH